jgi:hypothetical protein
MGAMLVCWVLFPAVLGAISLGCGLALERASGHPFSTALLLPAGFATMIVLAGLPIAISPLAELATPLVVAVAILGLVVGRLPRERRIGEPVVLAAVVFVFYGAPVILSGQATFLGFGRLDDTSTWLGITDWVMSHGRDLSGLAPSTYEYVLKNYIGTGYPVGSFLPVGIGHVLLRQDVAWLFQPTISYMGAMLGLALYALAEPLIRSPLRRGIVAAVGAQGALLLGYAWWGSIKEVAAAGLLALAAAFAAPLFRWWPGMRGLLPLGVVVAAFGGVYSAGGIVWLLPVLVATAVAVVCRYRGQLARALARFRVAALIVLAIAAVLLLPAISTLSSFLGPAGTQFSTTTDLGILSRPLSALQGFGIWPAGDLRSSPVNGTATDLLVALTILAALAGLAIAWKRRGWGLLLYALVSLVSGGVIFLTAGPWIAAKALAVVSPAAPFCALAAAAIAYERGRRIEGIVVAALVAGGVLWSNVLQYHAVNLAPRAQLVELQHIGGEIKGEGPTLLTSADHYAGRHFLRAGDPESVSDLHRREVVLRSGGAAAPIGTTQDLDAIGLASLLVYRSLVIRTSPAASRPPSPYQLVWRGRFYELWQRPASFTPVIEHLPLGTPDDPAAVPACRDVLALARAAGAAQIAYVLRDDLIRIPLATAPLPAGWVPSGAVTNVAYLGRGGQMDVTVTVTRAGVYRAWVGNSFRAHLEVLVDGHDAGGGRQALNVVGAYTPFATIPLAAGRHVVTLRYSGPDWHPGSGGQPPPTGPLVLSDQTADEPVLVTAPASARALCGKRLDWVEALG